MQAFVIVFYIKLIDAIRNSILYVFKLSIISIYKIIFDKQKI